MEKASSAPVVSPFVNQHNETPSHVFLDPDDEATCSIEIGASASSFPHSNQLNHVFRDI
jgi:hypothetical protein